MEEFRDIGQTQNDCALRGWPIRPVDLAPVQCRNDLAARQDVCDYTHLFSNLGGQGDGAEFQSFEVVNLGLA
jgi:hypothetical protein